MSKPIITQDILKSILRYDAKTGIFTWIDYAGKERPGSVAGTRSAHTGYTVITIKGGKFQAHRLAWLYVYGALPANDMDIDHRNRDRKDNRIRNLRIVTKAQNRQNVMKPQRNGSSGIRGVSKRPNAKRWRARVNIDGKTYTTFHNTKEEAASAYLEMKAKHHPFYHQKD